MKTMQTNIKQPYLPPEITIEEIEELCDFLDQGSAGTDNPDTDPDSDTDPLGSSAKSSVWGADFSFDDYEEDY